MGRKKKNEATRSVVNDDPHRPLTQEEISNIARWVGNLKRELDRVDPNPANALATSTTDYLQKLAWVQYEGIALEGRAIGANFVSTVLWLIAEHLHETLGVSLSMWRNQLVISHEHFQGHAPLELLAYRPLQVDESNWLDEDDPIDRACYAVELIENALKKRRIVGRETPMHWMKVLFGEPLLKLMAQGTQTS